MNADLLLALPDGTYHLAAEQDGWHWEGTIPECPSCDEPMVDRPGSRYVTVLHEWFTTGPAVAICDCGAEYPLTRREAVTR